MPRRHLAWLCAAVPWLIAADHAEAPIAGADSAADIADLYAWHTDDGRIVVVLTYAGLTAAGGNATYDDEVLYGVHIDSDADNVADQTAYVRFGQDEDGSWGVQFSGVPGASGTWETAVESQVTDGALRGWAGLADDPFFFDLAGFTETLETGTLSFDSARDSLAGTNVTAIVFEMDAAAAAGDDDTVQIWATTARM